MPASYIERQRNSGDRRLLPTDVIARYTKDPRTGQ